MQVTVVGFSMSSCIERYDSKCRHLLKCCAVAFSECCALYNVASEVKSPLRSSPRVSEGVHGTHACAFFALCTVLTFSSSGELIWLGTSLTMLGCDLGMGTVSYVCWPVGRSSFVVALLLPSIPYS